MSTLGLGSVVDGAGFSLELEGAAHFDGLGADGSVDVHVYAAAPLVVDSSFSPGGGSFPDGGTFTVRARSAWTRPCFQNPGLLAWPAPGLVLRGDRRRAPSGRRGDARCVATVGG
jgi:hypothetical protein